MADLTVYVLYGVTGKYKDMMYRRIQEMEANNENEHNNKQWTDAEMFALSEMSNYRKYKSVKCINVVN